VRPITLIEIERMRRLRLWHYCSARIADHVAADGRRKKDVRRAAVAEATFHKEAIDILNLAFSLGSDVYRDAAKAGLHEFSSIQTLRRFMPDLSRDAAKTRVEAMSL